MASNFGRAKVIFVVSAQKLVPTLAAAHERIYQVPIANVYPLAQVREAYTDLERRHTHGKIVLRP